VGLGVVPVTSKFIPELHLEWKGASSRTVTPTSPFKSEPNEAVFPNIQWKRGYNLLVFRFPPRSSWQLRSSRLLSRIEVLSYGRFETTYRSHPQDYWTLMMGPIGCPEMLEINYYYSLRNNPEERSSQDITWFNPYPATVENMVSF